MAAHDSVLGEFLLHVLPYDSRLYAGHHVVLIDPLDLVHPRAVHRDDGPLLQGIHHETLSHVGPSPEGNQHHVVLLGCGDQQFGLLVGDYVYDVIHSPGQF